LFALAAPPVFKKLSRSQATGDKSDKTPKSLKFEKNTHLHGAITETQVTKYAQITFPKTQKSRCSHQYELENQLP